VVNTNARGAPQNSQRRAQLASIMQGYTLEEIQTSSR